MRINPRPLPVDFAWVDETAKFIYKKLIGDAAAALRLNKPKIGSFSFKIKKLPSGKSLSIYGDAIQELKTIEITFNAMDNLDHSVNPLIIDGFYDPSSSKKEGKITLRISAHPILFEPYVFLDYLAEDKNNVLFSIGVILAHELSHVMEYDIDRDEYMLPKTLDDYSEYINQSSEILSLKAEIYYFLHFIFTYLPCSTQEKVIETFENYNAYSAFNRLLKGTTLGSLGYFSIRLNYIAKKNRIALIDLTYQWFFDNNVKLNRARYLKTDLSYYPQELIDSINEVLMVLRLSGETLGTSPRNLKTWEEKIVGSMVDSYEEGDDWFYVLLVSKKEMGFYKELASVEDKRNLALKIYSFYKKYYKKEPTFEWFIDQKGLIVEIDEAVDQLEVVGYAYDFLKVPLKVWSRKWLE